MDGGHDQLPRPKPTQPTRKPKSQDPGEAYCILLVSPVGCISQNTHFRLHSKYYTEAIYKLLVVGGSGVGWGYWPAGILEAAFWSPRKHPATKPPFLQLLFFNGAMLVLVVIVGFLPSLSVVLQRGVDVAVIDLQKHSSVCRLQRQQQTLRKLFNQSNTSV